jgi:hypothetical protein
MDINFNPATPEGQQQLQTQGVKLISKIPYGGTDYSVTAQPTANEESEDEDDFIDGLFSAFGIGSK